MSGSRHAQRTTWASRFASQRQNTSRNESMLPSKKLVVEKRCEDCGDEWTYYARGRPAKCVICGGRLVLITDTQPAKEPR
jgi:ribosomal protein S27E